MPEAATAPFACKGESRLVPPAIAESACSCPFSGDDNDDDDDVFDNDDDDDDVDIVVGSGRIRLGPSGRASPPGDLPASDGAAGAGCELTVVTLAPPNSAEMDETTPSLPPRWLHRTPADSIRNCITSARSLAAARGKAEE